jgi:hypothetical protein
MIWNEPTSSELCDARSALAGTIVVALTQPFRPVREAAARIVDVDAHAARQLQGRCPLDHVRTNRTAELRNQRIQRPAGGIGKVISPDRVGQLIAIHWPVAVQREVDQQQPPLAPRQRLGAPPAVDLHRQPPTNTDRQVLGQPNPPRAQSSLVIDACRAATRNRRDYSAVDRTNVHSPTVWAVPGLERVAGAIRSPEKCPQHDVPDARSSLTDGESRPSMTGGDDDGCLGDRTSAWRHG